MTTTKAILAALWAEFRPGEVPPHSGPFAADPLRTEQSPTETANTRNRMPGRGERERVRRVLTFAPEKEGPGIGSEGGNFGGVFSAAGCCAEFSDAVQERAAILEFEAGVNRVDADRRARVLTATYPPCQCDAGRDCI